MLKFGIIGMSPGNAHPYSWAAIINGCYNAEEISKMGYPGVSAYLDANRDTLGMNSASVTHVWTQDRKISESIANTTGIENIVTNRSDMIGKVDAILLTRDDPENHVEMAKPFIEAGIPIFIDKPLAISTKDLNYFSGESARGKLIMSCSSMRYANECRTAKTEIASLGKIELVTATGKKDWIKYGVHLLEGVVGIMDDPKPVSVKNIGRTEKNVVYIEYETGLMVVINIFMDIVPTFQISLFGQQGWKTIDIKNSYSMFRDNITEFIRSVQEGRARLDFKKTDNIIRTLIAGKESLEKGGKTIYLKV
jgi:predicted dehydrogenase